jgi:hypothetical protein
MHCATPLNVLLQSAWQQNMTAHILRTVDIVRNELLGSLTYVSLNFTTLYYFTFVYIEEIVGIDGGNDKISLWEWVWRQDYTQQGSRIVECLILVCPLMYVNNKY